MDEVTPVNPMDEDLQHLETNLHRLAHIARTLARDVDAIESQLWNEPYAYRAALDAVRASVNLRSQLEKRWLVTPLSDERPDDLSPRTSSKNRSYPRVTERGPR